MELRLAERAVELRLEEATTALHTKLCIVSRVREQETFTAWPGSSFVVKQEVFMLCREGGQLLEWYRSSMALLSTRCPLSLIRIGNGIQCAARRSIG